MKYITIIVLSVAFILIIVNAKVCSGTAYQMNTGTGSCTLSIYEKLTNHIN
jgi:hypothetical protein